MRHWAIAFIASLSLAVPVEAGIVFSDNFDAENGGVTGLNYTAFANFTVTGQVDIVLSGDGGVIAAGGTGSAVDLVGTPSPGELTSLASYAFNAGDKVRLSYDLSGNQRSSASDNWHSGFNFTGSVDLIDYGIDYFGSDIIIGDFPGTAGISTSSSIPGDAPYATRSVFFTAGTAGVFQFFIGALSDDPADNQGAVLDNVTLDITSVNAVPEPGSLTLLGLGSLGLFGFARRRRIAA